MQNNGIKYSNYQVVFQEVPDEISLVFNITNCPYRCKGCHSEFLQQDIGNYLENDIERIIKQYEGMITCICLMGGDHDIDSLSSVLNTIKKYNTKACLYSGCDDLSKFSDLIGKIDYLKVGSYKEKLGGLSSSTTNQRFYRIQNGDLIDITARFQKKESR